MADDIEAALRLIRQVERKPRLLEKKRDGALRSIAVGEAVLAVADHAARQADLDTLGWLWDVLIDSFLEHQRPQGDGASFIDLYEYVTDLYYSLEDKEDPFDNAVITQHRRSIVEDLKRARRELVPSRTEYFDQA
jgi:hypothetical protein